MHTGSKKLSATVHDGDPRQSADDSLTHTAATEEPSATTSTVHDGDPRQSADDSLTQRAATEEPSATTFTVHESC